MENARNITNICDLKQKGGINWSETKMYEGNFNPEVAGKPK